MAYNRDIYKERFPKMKGIIMSKVEVSINGKDIELNPFVEEFIKNTVKGMISSLRGYEKGKIKIEVED
ncbi:MAG: hypothetical protein AMQ74_00462 [Candidatus Methanofastidiosum methylothiophilum]|uniref:Uncharacterized protein n=1 Tax=Candidatus Methanofastidiosum methylothiophilum TaxID=1705564 RepID=A0A150J7L8_9EURY|nr:MAG: hypothetical protein AMQ74_00462 [Candidatus Methanofastidiosum methylthiophilus]